MARFNTKTITKRTPNTVNLAGGKAFTESERLEIFSILACSFTTDQFYRSGNDTIQRLRELTQKDPKFVAQAAVYARQELGMRSITHAAIAEVLYVMRGVGEPWVKKAVAAVIRRPDDMTEILSYYLHVYKDESIPNALKKGMATAFDKFDGYNLAKYRGEGNEVKLIDVVNLVHPKPTETNKKALKDLVKGKLTSTDTWEVMLTKAGQKGENAEEKAKLKEKAWKKLIKEGNLPYFAALRNLRNIAEQAPSVLDDVLALITDRELIKKSLVMPFRFTTAIEAIDDSSISSHVRSKILAAIDEATEYSLDNVPKFSGKTLVALDTSGSMQGRPSQIGSLFAAVLCKTNKADLITFDTAAFYHTIKYRDSVTSIAKNIPFRGGGTDFRTIFTTASEAYDRIIILSDMQGWIANYGLAPAFKAYKKEHTINPALYSFDLAGLGTLMFPEDKVYTVAGFNEKILEMMPLLEEDKEAIVHKIQDVEFDDYIFEKN